MASVSAAGAADAASEDGRKRQLAREHSRRKHKRQRERAWAELGEALSALRDNGVDPDTAEAVRQLREPEPAGFAVIDWTKAPPAVLPAINSRKRSELREKRKREQADGYTRILAAAFDPDAPLTLVDFGCGSGNLTAVLAWRFPKWQFVGVDMKPTCIELLQKRAVDAGLTNLHGVEAMVADADLTGVLGQDGKFDIAIALHACGNATDDALRRAQAVGASFVVSPCCAGKMCGSISGGAALGIENTSQFATIASFADHAADESREDARSAKRVIEMDRLAWARGKGYCASLLALTPDLSYPKNDCLLGIHPPATLDQLLVPP